MVTISLCMIVKNEQDVIGRCLESVKEIVDEIINNNKFEPKNDQLILEAFIKVISRTPINQNKLPQLKENEILFSFLEVAENKEWLSIGQFE